LLDQLRDLHERTCTAALEMERLTAATSADPRLLPGARLQLARLSRLRTTLLDQTIYPMLLARLGSVDAETLYRLRDERMGVARIASEHTGYWTPERVTADWAGYQRACVGMFAAIRARVEAERAALYPLIEKATALARSDGTSTAKAA